ncbi:MAG: acetyl-CoA carboxylase biotin carboxyl carrier protein [Legionella sp.]|nr:acetyl-CoA carboxylase biotin carboxyl carrier protein [Legionella sp.]
MDIRKIRKLIELMEETDISEIEIKEGEESLRLSRHHKGLAEPAASHTPHHQYYANQAPTPISSHTLVEANKQETPILASGYKIRSPMVGTLYTSPSPELPVFVKIGQTVKVGDVLCIVEAMKMFNEIEADRAGKIIEMLVSNGDPVEYDQPLFILEELK